VVIVSRAFSITPRSRTTLEPASMTSLPSGIFFLRLAAVPNRSSSDFWYRSAVSASTNTKRSHQRSNCSVSTPSVEHRLVAAFPDGRVPSANHVVLHQQACDNPGGVQNEPFRAVHGTLRNSEVQCQNDGFTTTSSDDLHGFGLSRNLPASSKHCRILLKRRRMTSSRFRWSTVSNAAERSGNISAPT